MSTSIYTEHCHWCEAVLCDDRADDMHCSPQCIEWTRQDDEDRVCRCCQRSFTGPIHGALQDGRGYCSDRCEWSDHGEDE